MKCVLWHNNLGSPKNWREGNLQSPTKAPNRSWWKGASSRLESSVWSWISCWRGALWFQFPCLGLSTLQSCKGETPASPHPQGFRPVPWRPHAILHLPGTERPKPWVLGRVYRKQLLASQAQVMLGPLPAAVLTNVHASSHTHPCSSPYPHHGTHTCRVWVFVFLVSGWFLNKQKI